MYNYKTVEEKAADWNVTPRHIQYLCRLGKIQGATKRAGSWFIPEDAPSPIKNTKKDAKAFNFSGTKQNIFNSAIQLFMTKGFGYVSLRDIASSVGVRQSTIYNHFASKQEILDTIYDYYCYYFLKDRPDMSEIEHVLRHKSLLEVIQHIRYDFKEAYRQKLSDISKIIFQRIAIDERARQISKTLIVDEGIRFVEDVFNKGVEMGRFAPFDTHAMAVFVNSVRIFTFYNWIIDSSIENIIQFSSDEQTLYSYVTVFIEDLKPPAGR